MVDCTAAMATHRNTVRAVALLLGLVALTAAVVVPAQAGGKSVALLGVHLQNDNEMYEPTSDAERARMVTVAEIFKHQLSASERYSFVEVPPDVQSKIAAGRTMGECGGCEIEYGQSLGSEIVAWITVQKISKSYPEHERLHGRCAGQKDLVRAQRGYPGQHRRVLDAQHPVSDQELLAGTIKVTFAHLRREQAVG